MLELFLLISSFDVSFRYTKLWLLFAQIDLTSHIVKVFLTLKVLYLFSYLNGYPQNPPFPCKCFCMILLYFVVNVFFKVKNVGTLPASDVLLAFPPTEFDRLSLIKASIATGKKKKKSYVPLDVKPMELPDAPNGAKGYSISLLNPLSPGTTATFEVLYLSTRTLKPFPEEISQSEPQLVFYHDSALILSPYHIKQQSTFIKTPTTKVESFTKLEPTNRVSKEIRYGPYEDRLPYSFSPILLHFENNYPFAVVEELVREIEISHWGSIQITEHYKLAHAGARHKGVFSR